MMLLQSPDEKMVAKFSYSPDECAGNDFYPEFAKWAILQNNPHLPKMYQCRSMRYYGVFLTIMEKLTHCNVHAIEDHDYDYNTLNAIDTKIHVLVTACRVKNINTLSALNIGRLTRTLVDMVAKFGGFPTDLHAGNVMLRGNTIVITDPYSCGPCTVDTYTY